MSAFFHGEEALNEELCFSMAGDGWVFFQELKMAGIFNSQIKHSGSAGPAFAQWIGHST